MPRLRSKAPLTVNVLEELRHDIEGALLLDDWLGEGGEPVSQTQADYRADQCLHGNGGDPCPLNIEPNWWDRVKEAIADTIRAELELKKRINLRVIGEPELAMCKPCGCCLKLKVWTPIKHIKKHLSEESLDQMPNFCWQKIEIERLNHG